MRRPLTTLAAASAVAAVVLTGCGGSSGAGATQSKDPKAAFSTGLQGLSDTNVLTVTFKLETTPDKLIGFARESGDKLDAKTAQEIATAALVLESKTSDGSHLGDMKPGSKAKALTRFAVQDNGTTLAELRGLPDALYVQADVKTLLDTFGKSSMYTDLAARGRQMPAFIQAFLQGKWVSLDVNALKGMASQFGVSASPSQQQGQKLLTDLRAVLGRDVTVTRVGTDSQGDHLKVSTDARTFITDLVQTASSDIPGAGLATGQLKPADIPSRTVVVDAWVSGGSLSKLSLDLVQFAKPGEAKPGDSLPLVLTFERSGSDISAPSGAERVDLTQLFTLLGGLGKK